MTTLANAFFLDSKLGELRELPKAGSSLENPYVFDSAAREIEAMAARGLVEIVSLRRASHTQDALVNDLHFKRLR